MSVTVVIPSRNERFLNNTITDLLTKAAGDIEVIAVLDGYWPSPIIGDSRVKYIHRGAARGMRAAINAGASIATKKFLMKTDAHCMFEEGFDEVLAADCDDDWVVVPRRKRLDAENWAIQEVGKPDIDYMYLSYPDDPNDWGGPGMHGRPWDQRNKDGALKSVLIDDLMSWQGSMWFMPRDYFYRLELMDDVNYGSFMNEPQEIGLKCWLSGGRMIVNKKTWYAHLHKGKKYGRGYSMSKQTLNMGAQYTHKWFSEPIGVAWHGAKLPLTWLVEKFWPVPTWPDDRNLWTFVRETT